MDVFKWIWQYLKGFKARLISGFFIILLMSALAMVNPYISKIIVDDVIIGGRTSLLLTLLLVLTGATLVRTVTRYFFALSFEYISQSTVYKIRKDIYDRIQSFDFEYFDRTRTGDIMARMTGDIEAVRHFTAWVVHTALENVIVLIFAVVVLFTINVPLALLMFAITPTSFYFVKKFSGKVKPAFSAIREQFSRLNTVVQENISGNRVVKAFTRERFEERKFAEENEAFRQKNVEAAKIWADYIPILDSVAGLLTVAMIIAGGAMVIGGSITLGGFIAFSGYIWALNNPMRMAGWIVNDVQRFSASADKIMRLIEVEPRIKDIVPVTGFPEGTESAEVTEVAEVATTDDGAGVASDTDAVSEIAMVRDLSCDTTGIGLGSVDEVPAVEFRDVCFNYGSEPVLEHINLKVKKGQTVAFIGPTGSGKTTLVNLIGRFYDCVSGEVLVDGRNVRETDIGELRGKVGMAMQDVFLFSDTIEGNIGYAIPGSPAEDIEKVARMACVDDFIRYFGEKYDTIIGERGVGLSGGQKQRISLARALLTEPPILILDDTTSSLDFETEFRIQTILGSVYKDRTTFIISHRISSVCNADVIYVLDKGRIVESGSHAELLELGGYYRKVYMSQVGEFLEDAMHVGMDGGK